MIVSASRRTDIPAFYGQWLLNRLKEGYALVPNPRNPKLLSKVLLSPDTCEAIVFWTKNPLPLMPLLPQIEDLGYDYLFQYTLNPYGPSVEPNLPTPKQRLEAFEALSARIGPARIDWRYDPILIAHGFDEADHLRWFERLCARLAPCTTHCTVSFVDAYAKMRGRFDEVEERAMQRLAKGISQTAGRHGLELFSCAELADLGIRHGACIDAARIGQAVGKPIKARKDPNQRGACLCSQSAEIGMYDTCGNGCAYCYANASEKAVQARMQAHDPASPLLSGWPGGDETIKERRL